MTRDPVQNQTSQINRNRLRHGIAGVAFRSSLVKLACVATVALWATTARAETAMDRCLRNDVADAIETVTFDGYAGRAAFPSGADPINAIRPGDVVRVTAWGSVRYDFLDQNVSPFGLPSIAGADAPFPGMRQLSSIARFNKQGANGGWVGAPLQTSALATCTLVPSSPERLLFYMNDGNLQDNGGEWFIRTELFFHQ